MSIPGNLLTTAMAVMPHTNADRALELALSLDVPFWPQLPRLSYFEDMYVQASEHFPGIVLNDQERTLGFSMDKFVIEFEETLAHYDEPDYFDISDDYSSVYNRFLAMDLSERPAIRGQIEGPISFGMNILDSDERPILFDDTIRPLILEVLAKRVNVQLKRLKGVNANAFMYVDEPGLQFLFSGLSGYSDTAAREDLSSFFAMTDRPRGIHLCGNPDWDLLLGLDLDILSLDVYSNGEIFVSYADAIKRFVKQGGVLAWGIVPTNFEPFEEETLKSLEERLKALWDSLSRKGVDLEFLLTRSLLSPATCCLVNPDGEKTVEMAFNLVRELSLRLREEYRLF
ncbi:MAG: hypothetical protein JRI34_02160 [Deltaproteobacteria bacterium]|nr:hypothetical protein [Deltaproteobacteria bacterium]